jgi:crotonobetainyl-CoA:carnitine CoA-transferase CaiB-like acyl-CoA transferase
VVVEAAMVDAALNVAAEQVLEHSAYGALLGREGNRGPGAAPQNLYRTADADEDGTRDTWVAIAVTTDDEWAALRTTLDSPRWAMDPALDTAAGRHAQHDLLDEHLAAWCEERSADAVVDCLWTAGVPVAKVLQPHDQAGLEQLQARGFFEDVEHPVTGSARHSTLPFRLSRGPDRFHVRHAPLLGEHNEVVLASLGVSDDELAELAEAGVVGRAPQSGT